jgi:hypothetical protein
MQRGDCERLVIEMAAYLAPEAFGRKPRAERPAWADAPAADSTIPHRPGKTARGMSTVTSSTPPTSAGAGRPWPGDDFADWLPPMLVRELRQGIQSGAFFWTFLLLQGALVLHAAFTVLGSSGAFDGPLGRTSGGFFWTILVVSVVLVIPLRGLQAVAHERVGNNLDLVRLTRLSATRIVVGKWAALVAQVLLVTAAILPYLVLRYFIGGVNVVGELGRLGWLVVAAAVVAALAVYASTRPQRERVGLMALVVFGGWGSLMGIMTRGGFVGATPGWFGLGVAALYATLLLDAAAASIAPASENRAFWKRLLGLGCAAAVATAGLFGGPADFVPIAVALGLPVLVLVVGAVCERPVRFRRLHAAFARGGIVGRLAAAVLTPGWATGLVFAALAGGLTAIGFLAQAAPIQPVMAACVSLVAAAVVFPLPLLLAFPKVKERATLYVAVQAVCLVIFGIDAFVRGMPGSSRNTLAIVVPFPLAGLLRLFADGTAAATLFLAGLVVLAIVLAILARPWWREMRETQRLVGSGTRP